MEYQRLEHTFLPVCNVHTRILVLGTFPSVKSRENQFYYGHPQNRFWKVLAGVFEKTVPETIEEKRRFLLSLGIGLWDVVASCEIKGSSDVSIRNVIPNDIKGLLQMVPVEKILANGGTAFRLYEKYCRESTCFPAVKLPSTSPANAAWSLERLKEAWGKELKYL